MLQVSRVILKAYSRRLRKAQLLSAFYDRLATIVCIHDFSCAVLLQDFERHFRSVQRGQNGVAPSHCRPGRKHSMETCPSMIGSALLKKKRVAMDDLQSGWETESHASRSNESRMQVGLSHDATFLRPFGFMISNLFRISMTTMMMLMTLCR